MIVSFGFGHHDDLPRALVTFDLRDELRDPGRMSDDLRAMTGLCPGVQRVVWTTPGAPGLANSIITVARSHPGRTILVGCGGGRHRAPAVAELVAAHSGHEVRLLHIARDLLPQSDRPGGAR